MFWWIFLAIFLFLLCAVLLVAEVFVPSFGLITLCAITSLIGGIVIFFKLNPTAGWCGIIVAVIMIPATLVFAYKIFPKTRFGKSVSLDGPKRQKGDAISDTDQLEALLGQKAKAITMLRPVGMCDFAGTRLECVAETGYVEKGKTVEVIKVEGTQLTVREIENS
ncbi:MAG: NfeD family protein [Phycisphaerae bacterium]|jgi:membrane-bound serine protease (ClpP class)